jgi:hypothetical protein
MIGYIMRYSNNHNAKDLNKPHYLDLTFDKVFESGYEALNLAYKFGVQDSVEKIPEFIIQGKKTIE